MRSVLPRRSLPGIVASSLILALFSSASAAEIAVPADVATIQQAIVVAQPGDTVVVAPGTYTEPIDFLGRAITVRSSGGPDVTIIDGQNVGPVVTFAAGEDAASVLEGFTIRGGRISGFDLDLGGAGIFIQGASPVIRGNIIRENISTFNGAGAFCVDSTARFEDNQFIDNLFEASVADIEFGLGGGLHVRGGAVEVVGCRFEGNIGGDRGGALFLEDTQGSRVETCGFFGNQGGYGGAIAIDGNSIVEVENVLIVGNTAFGHVSIAGPSPGLGGGIYIAGPSSAEFRNATILENEAVSFFNGDGVGGGVYAATIVALLPLVDSSIVRGNIANVDPQLVSMPTVFYSDVEGGLGGTGNFDLDPLFVPGPLGEHYLSHVATGQASDSPCIDAGNPASVVPSETTTRTDGGPDAGIVDVGFHFPVPGLPFRRGDCNSDGTENIADAIFLLSSLFPGPSPAPPPQCDDACDGNDDGALNIADAIAILSALFGSTQLPPPSGSCGPDPTPDAISCAVSPGC